MGAFDVFEELFNDMKQWALMVLLFFILLGCLLLFNMCAGA